LQAGLAHLDQPVLRSDDALRRAVRGDLPDHPHRPALAGGVLAVSVSEHDDAVAELPQTAHLGRLRGLDLRPVLAARLVRGPHAGSRDDARQGAAPGGEEALRRALARLAGIGAALGAL